MTEVIARSYEALVLRRPWLSLLAVALLLVASASQLHKIKSKTLLKRCFISIQ